jgi:hypothetical protein
MKYRVRHVTLYRYAKTVDLASHLLHLMPRALPHQSVLGAAIAATPEPGRSVTRRDHFGNAVQWLFLDRPHDRFEVILEARVEVRPVPVPPVAGTLPWEQVAAAARQGGPGAWEAAEFGFDSPMVPRAATPPPVSRPGGRCSPGCSN